MKKYKTVYVVRDEITDMGSIVTYDYNVAKKYARSLVKNYRDKVLGMKSELNFTNPQLIKRLKAEKIKSLYGGNYYSYWGRKAEVEEAIFL